MIKIKPITTGDKLLKHLIDYARCPICGIDVLRNKLNKHIKGELADDHILGDILSDQLLELKHDKKI